MSTTTYTSPTAAAPVAAFSISARSARGIVAMAIIAAIAGGLMSTDLPTSTRAAAAAGADLTRLLRVMAAIKAVMAVGATAGVFWRLALPISPARLTLYAVACAAMAAGPVLIWNMVDLVAGALLLHAGLASSVILLWRDPAAGLGLSASIARRRAALRR